MPFVASQPRPSLSESTSRKCVDFADRELQSEAMAASLAFMADVLRGDRVISAFSHVLVFHGGSGTGKTALSHRLENWILGGVTDDFWGPPPPIGNVVTARWDLNSSQGDVDIISLLLSFRAALPPIPGGWKFFDMALLSYFNAVRPGESLDLTSANENQRAVLSGAFDAIANDVGFHLDLGVGIAAHAIKTVVAMARKKLTERQMHRYHDLGAIIDRCGTDVSNASPSPEVAAAVLEVANQQLSEIPDPSQRPLVVVFVDHFERLQTDDRRLGEIAINQLVAALPQCLFVVTGRNHLDWADPARVFLPHWGPKAWPHLVEGFSGSNPRQHRLSMLGEKDTEWLLRRRAIRQGFHLSDTTVKSLVRRTGGWPVHIDAICTLAAGLSQGTGAEVSAQDLDRPLEEVVRRVLENLTENQARAFHGACLLPYFDVPLASAVAGVSEADVECMIRRAIIETNTDPRWPYRVHDAVRAIIRTAPATVAGSWTVNDWKAAAHRGLTYVQDQFEETDASDDELKVIALAGLAVTIAAEHGIWEEWLSTRVVSRAPVEALAPLVPRSSTHPETDALVRYLQARIMPSGDEPLRVLGEIFGGRTRVARAAGLDRAYKLRAWGRHDESLDQLHALVERAPEWRIPVGQIGITLNSARRFEDALAYALTVNERSQRYIRHNQSLILGDPNNGSYLPWEERIAAATNARYQVELQCAHARWQTRVGHVAWDDVEWRYRRAVNVGHLGGQRACQYAFTCLSLADDSRYAGHLGELLSLTDSEGRPCKDAVEVAALRAMLTQNDADAQLARELANGHDFRGAVWIAGEIFLEELGYPLNPMPTQWVEPYQVVRDRWLAIADGMIARARENVHGA